MPLNKIPGVKQNPWEVIDYHNYSLHPIINGVFPDEIDPYSDMKEFKAGGRQATEMSNPIIGKDEETQS